MAGLAGERVCERDNRCVALPGHGGSAGSMAGVTDVLVWRRCCILCIPFWHPSPPQSALSQRRFISNGTLFESHRWSGGWLLGRLLCDVPCRNSPSSELLHRSSGARGCPAKISAAWRPWKCVTGSVLVQGNGITVSGSEEWKLERVWVRVRVRELESEHGQWIKENKQRATWDLA